ncbi:ABC-ATPase domain-containing protein [Kallotenue papyrolyticum]|uniref:ABC-ATPase domain-containing protein n=1 Tax=Kallotenue papyrolyticum TaxID=1325125 RepID=UPI0004AEDADB|nr:ABC-ATPase domain-containing protein [Kallotenue papyrolyticum]
MASEQPAGGANALPIQQLRALLERIDGRGYGAYKEIAGSYAFEHGLLAIDHVQGDPFAAPSKVRLRVPMEQAALPPDLWHGRTRRIALEDWLARQVQAAIRRVAQGRRGSGKSGLIGIDAGGQTVLERTAVRITAAWVEARLDVGLPAQGRTVLGRQAAALLCEELPLIARQSLLWRSLDAAAGRAFVICVENQEHLRAQLDALGLVAFVGDGAILPRASGVSDRPLPRAQAVPFRAPDALRVTLELPQPMPGQREPRISGMGIPRGVTLIVGGGYHGKSTLLRALERAVYAHIPGDGRELVVSSARAVKVRAEDGRRIARVDLSPFIGTLPFGQPTDDFSTENASGSTSQAATIIEALEAGAQVLLIDEDTSATNFMVRDARMQALVRKEHEPITPLIDRVRELYVSFGVSTILVMGGSGDYFDVADTVIMLRDYQPVEVTAQARAIATAYPTQRRREVAAPWTRITPRAPQPESFDASRGRREVKIDARARDLLLYGDEPIDLRAVEQVVDRSQTRAIGYALHAASTRFMDGQTPLSAVLDSLEAWLDRQGLDALDPFRRDERHPGNFARPRRHEIAAAINRLRTVRMRLLR